MNRIARHQVNIENLREDAEALREDLPEAIEAARRDLVHCNSLKMDALDYAAEMLALDPVATDEACRALRVSAQATAAVFAGALATTDQIEIAIGDGPPSLVSTEVDPSIQDVGNWTDGFFAAVICRDTRALEILQRVSVSLLRRSTTRAHEASYLFAEALQAFHHRDFSLSRASADAALAATQSWTGRDPASQLALCAVDVHLRLLDGEAAKFNEALYRALEQHGHYWSTDEFCADPRGYVAIELTGLASLAHDAGIPVAVASDYLPISLVGGACSTNGASSP